MGEMIKYKRPDGKEAGGYYASPADKKNAPGVVVIQEWWGINPQLKRICDRWAQAGYRALAPDIYNGKLTTDMNEAAKLMNGTNFIEAAEQYVRGAVQHLKKEGGKVAVTGYCMGGAITIISAVKIPEADAAVCFYGIPPDTVAHPKDIKIPFQGHFANTDDWCNPKAVNDLEAKLKTSRSKFEIYRYDAQHAFCNEDRKEVYNEAAAKQAWERAQKFVKANVG